MRRLLAIFAAVLLALPLTARQQTRDLAINVVVGRDGTATVTQRWDVYVNEGTEWYIPLSNLGHMTVDGLEVSENGVPFESVGKKWDVDWSRSRKTGKCGIVPKSKGAELCWGIGDYGEHVWTVTFQVHGFILGYDDADAIYFTFVSPGMAASPDHVTLTIVPGFDCPQWTYDNTRVWGFGFYGDINVVDGKVFAESSESFGYSSKLVALVKFQDNALNWDQAYEDKFFEELENRKKAVLEWVNKTVGKNSKIGEVDAMKEPFEKTATQKIRRFKYKDSHGDEPEKSNTDEESQKQE